VNAEPLLLRPEPALDAEGATPVMQQFFEAKRRQPDALVFFRMGDFYELFFEDAKRAAEALGIALTYRGKHGGADIPMAGVPVHASEAYLAKLIRSGFKVAVCEQMEDPAEARKRGSKSIVRREIVRVVTPGTLTEDSLLDARGANRLAAVCVRAGKVGLAAVELSTGEALSFLLELEELGPELAALRPSEILVPDRLFADGAVANALKAASGLVQPAPSALADPQAAEDRLKRLYGVLTLDGFGAFAPCEIGALGLIAAHLDATQAGRCPALQPPRRAGEVKTLLIDPATRASLEIERTQGGGRDGSLLGAVDRTVTGPGARRLADRLARPLVDPKAIGRRLDAVEYFVERRDRREAVRAELRGGGDMARALSRLALGRGGPRDLGLLRAGLTSGSALMALFARDLTQLDAAPAEIADALGALDPAADADLQDFLDTLSSALKAELPAAPRDGGFVAEGFRGDLDEARAFRDEARRLVAAMEAELQLAAGVPLKVRHNGVLGYFVEASAKAAEPLFQPPLNAHFIHRQTLANQARFTTARLAELDANISRAADRALALELEIFESLRTRSVGLAPRIQAAAAALAELDVASALAVFAAEEDAVRPEVDDSLVFTAEGGRHPVVEAAVRRDGHPYTPNDCRLDGAGLAGPRLAIVTGPNMAGKSTFLRQNALLAVLAQSGSFVPAARFRLGVADRLFSRVGAGDDLAKGRSTFMMEMVETAAILTQATTRSIVVLDEIGRGTATYDGLALAWACAEALYDVNQCRALFATHYHELAKLEGRREFVCNLSMRAKEWNGDLVFLHEAGPGAADRSYGVQVARLAGVPQRVVDRAREVLERLEGQVASPARLEDLPLFAPKAAPALAPGPSAVETALQSLEPDDLSPREALEALYRLRALLDRKVS
jgi:DNA mismatch repair protein MutS